MNYQAFVRIHPKAILVTPLDKHFRRSDHLAWFSNGQMVRDKLDLTSRVGSGPCFRKVTALNCLEDKTSDTSLHA